jgi:hypothetical protein
MAYEFPQIPITEEQNLAIRRLSGEQLPGLAESRLLQQAEQDILLTGMRVAQSTASPQERHQFPDGSVYASYRVTRIPTDDPDLTLGLEARGNFRQNGVEPATLIVTASRHRKDEDYDAKVVSLYGSIRGETAAVLHGKNGAEKQVNSTQYRDLQELQKVLQAIAAAAGVMPSSPEAAT